MATPRKRQPSITKKREAPAFQVSRRLQYFSLLAAGLFSASSLIVTLSRLATPTTGAASQTFTSYLVVSMLTPVVIFSLAYLIVGRRLARDILGQLFGSLLAAVTAFSVSTLFFVLLSALFPALQTLSTDRFLFDWVASTALMVLVLLCSLFVTNTARLSQLLKLVFSLATIWSIASVAVTITTGIIQQIPTNPNLSSFVGMLVFPLSLIGFIAAILLNAHIKSLLDRLFDATLIMGVLFGILSTIQLIVYEYGIWLWLDASNATGGSFSDGTLATIQIGLVIGYLVIIGALIMVVMRRRLRAQPHSSGRTRRNSRKN